MMIRRRWRVLVSMAVVALFPTAVSAHPMPGVGDFYAGMLHPLITIESLLPLIALGLLAGQQGRRVALTMWVAIPVGMTAGATIALFTPLPAGSKWIALGSMAILGLLIAAARRVPLVVAVALTLVSALTIGWTSGAEIGSDVSAIRFIPGVALAGLLLVTYALGGVRRLKAPSLLIGVRVVGSWIAAVGILLLGLA